jgi:hypothetical protein
VLPASLLQSCSSGRLVVERNEIYTLVLQASLKVLSEDLDVSSQGKDSIGSPKRLKAS